MIYSKDDFKEQINNRFKQDELKDEFRAKVENFILQYKDEIVNIVKENPNNTNYIYNNNDFCIGLTDLLNGLHANTLSKSYVRKIVIDTLSENKIGINYFMAGIGNQVIFTEATIDCKSIIDELIN